MVSSKIDRDSLTTTVRFNNAVLGTKDIEHSTGASSRKLVNAGQDCRTTMRATIRDGWKQRTSHVRSHSFGACKNCSDHKGVLLSRLFVASGAVVRCPWPLQYTRIMLHTALRTTLCSVLAIEVRCSVTGTAKLSVCTTGAQNESLYDNVLPSSSNRWLDRPRIRRVARRTKFFGPTQTLRHLTSKSRGQYTESGQENPQENMRVHHASFWFLIDVSAFSRICRPTRLSMCDAFLPPYLRFCLQKIGHAAYEQRGVEHIFRRGRLIQSRSCLFMVGYSLLTLEATAETMCLPELSHFVCTLEIGHGSRTIVRTVSLC